MTPDAALVEASVFDGYSIPYPDKKFDLAILSHVVEHVEHPRQLLYEAARIARQVYVEVPLEHTLRMRKDYKQDPVGHINFYTDKTIRRLLQTCGFTILEQRLADDSYELLKMQHGKQGRIRHWLRRSGLLLVPILAKYIFVYNSAVLCLSPAEQSTASLV
jgi:ubiquinone/menaquinone biosynthesis C-methylase UbiE